MTFTVVLYNRYKFWHTVNDQNATIHSPISLAMMEWATKWWPNRVFAFLLSVTEVKAMLACILTLSAKRRLIACSVFASFWQRHWYVILTTKKKKKKKNRLERHRD
jgi:hypothetical protein